MKTFLGILWVYVQGYFRFHVHNDVYFYTVFGNLFENSIKSWFFFRVWSFEAELWRNPPSSHKNLLFCIENCIMHTGIIACPVDKILRMAFFMNVGEAFESMKLKEITFFNSFLKKINENNQFLYSLSI